MSFVKKLNHQYHHQYPNQDQNLHIGNDVDDKSLIQLQQMHSMQPYLEIIEQPQNKSIRFRYKSEGPSHGGLQGENSCKPAKSYPQVRIVNSNIPAKIVVNLVCHEEPYDVHAHQIVGRNCTDGICVVDYNTPQQIVRFQNLSIQHATKKNITKILQERMETTLDTEHYIRYGRKLQFSEREKRSLEETAKKNIDNMKLNIVALKFTAFLKDSAGYYSTMLQPVISNPIYDSKAPGANQLKICRMDKTSGCCTGEDEIFLLCDKVQKDDIEVLFYEEEDGEKIWEAQGKFSPQDVHRQYAIVFKTPPYMNLEIKDPVTVNIQLRRKKEDECSEPREYTYYPKKDIDEILSKKRKPLLFENGFPSGNAEKRARTMQFQPPNSVIKFSGVL